MGARGRTFVITGANSGLGAVTARTIAAAGGQVIMACRDMDKAKAVVAQTHAEVRREKLTGVSYPNLRSLT